MIDYPVLPYACALWPVWDTLPGREARIGPHVNRKRVVSRVVTWGHVGSRPDPTVHAKPSPNKSLDSVECPGVGCTLKGPAHGR